MAPSVAMLSGKLGIDRYNGRGTMVGVLLSLTLALAYSFFVAEEIRTRRNVVKRMRGTHVMCMATLTGL
jgi:hypothetical protein